MPVTNHERVGKGLELLQRGLQPFLEQELGTAYGPKWKEKANQRLSDTKLKFGPKELDAAAMLVIMDREWKDLFSDRLGKSHRAIVNEVIDIRNRWAHQETFSNDDTDRALDSTTRLLRSIGAVKEADTADEIKHELRRATFDRKVYNERRKEAYQPIEGTAPTGLKPWREVVTPHPDVASGNYQEAEFAADLWQVYKGNAPAEYRDPREFYRRTFLTAGLRELIVRAVRRWRKEPGGEPVVELQTTFGGGKTHSMLALYHLASGAPAMELPGMESVIAEAGGSPPQSIKRAILVGNQLTPGQPERKENGVQVHTLWGEMAYQLGGKKAYEKIRLADETGTNPGDAMGVVIRDAAPCLILIDEWVAYARQLMDERKLPAGDFETQFTFAQTLSEQVKAIPGALLVVSIPASSTGDGVSPSEGVSDEEVGGSRGREAVARLRNVFQRVASQWRPANAEESYEIVRRRLFDAITDKDAFIQRDLVVRAFTDHYAKHPGEFPSECRDSDYIRKMQLAYPVHPEVFERLYQDWSGLVRFQRTRGVLRLMASVIHALWESGDQGLLILPAHVPIGTQKIEGELTRYLPSGWTTVIEKDVDGPDATPRKIDADKSNLGRISATRRVARTLFVGSAPTADAANRGMEDRRIKLGCTLPGESPAIFGDALRYLSQAATYLYQDSARYWYATQPTVAKLAGDRAEDLKRQRDRVVEEIKGRVREELKAPRNRGDFSRVHAFPAAGNDVADEASAALVILGPETEWSKDANTPAIAAAQTILQSRGNSPRLFQNALAYLAPERARLDELEQAVRSYLAWDSILSDAEGDRPALNLDNFQRAQATSQRKIADQTVQSRISETFTMVLVPSQDRPDSPVNWTALRATGSDPLAVRASKKLKPDHLITSYGAVSLRMELDKTPLWRGNHVSIKQLVEDFARYAYLPRLSDPSVLVMATREGLGLLTWQRETFAFAEGYDEASGRYLGLRGGQNVAVSEDSPFGLLVKPDIAWKQMEEERPTVLPTPAPDPSSNVSPSIPSSTNTSGTTTEPPKPAAAPKPKRFHGTVVLDSQRVGRDAGKIAEEVIAHLASLVGSEVTVRLDIEASLPSGVPDHVVRTVTENARTLKFTSQGFESD
ncbi:Swt1 family HEPN domain-containing protein [Prosthecobacter sp.]|uniref:Swt1 family HEPN domain-containing protein n=1 Tax=Prosthecobacter sp. TaxID=1965333 RepID=UPI00378336DD